MKSPIVLLAVVLAALSTFAGEHVARTPDTPPSDAPTRMVRAARGFDPLSPGGSRDTFGSTLTRDHPPEVV
jgi:hypothetical protein